MKEPYKHLRCPNCGAQEIFNKDGDVFHCEYCNDDFSFDLEKIPVDNSTKEFRKELKSVFYEKIYALEDEKRVYKQLLKEYSTKERQQVLECVSVIVLILSIFLVFELIILPIMAIFSIPGFIFFFLARAYRKTKYKENHPFVVVLAAKIVACDDEITTYRKIISKLTE